MNGRGLNLPVLVRDYELLRWVGANSHRTSHYPYSEEAMDLADRLGVLVIDEIPAVSLNFSDPDDLTSRRLAQCRMQLRELIARDKNHPSVILWCVANEPMAGSPYAPGGAPARAVEAGEAFFSEMAAQARRLDATRPVTLVGVQNGPRNGWASSTSWGSTATTAGTPSAGGSKRRPRRWKRSWTPFMPGSASRSSSPSSARTR